MRMLEDHCQEHRNTEAAHEIRREMIKKKKKRKVSSDPSFHCRTGNISHWIDGMWVIGSKRQLEKKGCGIVDKKDVSLSSSRDKRWSI